jgi:hypothetical protein
MAFRILADIRAELITARTECIAPDAAPERDRDGAAMLFGHAASALQKQLR